MQASTIQRALSLTLDKRLRDELKNLMRFYENVAGQGGIKEQFGGTIYVAEILAFKNVDAVETLEK